VEVWLSYDIVRFKIEVGVDAKFICKYVSVNERDAHFDNDATRQPCFSSGARAQSMQLGHDLDFTVNFIARAV